MSFAIIIQFRQASSAPRLVGVYLPCSPELHWYKVESG